MRQGAVRIWKQCPTLTEFPYGIFVFSEASGFTIYEGRFLIYHRSMNSKGFCLVARLKNGVHARAAAEAIALKEGCPVSRNEVKQRV